MILVVDNYDSFTYNLVHLIGSLGFEMKVVRNDELSPEEARDLAPTHLVISPGPGRPENAGYSNEYIRTLSGTIPTLGVCLGHQAIGQVFGGKVVHASQLVHGKATPVFHEGRSIFANLPNPLLAGRYHSLAVDPDSLPGEIEVLAHSGDGQIMAIRHRDLPIIGVQFHPESILTTHGQQLIQNFMQRY